MRDYYGVIAYDPQTSSVHNAIKSVIEYFNIDVERTLWTGQLPDVEWEFCPTHTGSLTDIHTMFWCYDLDDTRPLDPTHSDVLLMRFRVHTIAGNLHALRFGIDLLIEAIRKMMAENIVDTIYVHEREFGTIHVAWKTNMSIREFIYELQLEQ